MSKAHGPGFKTLWLRKDPYSLGELARVIPFGWRRPTVSRTGVGRNCDLFQSLIRWAGCPENRENDCLAAAHVINQSFELPLPDSEVAGIAARVSISTAWDGSPRGSTSPRHSGPYGEGRGESRAVKPAQADGG